MLTRDDKQCTAIHPFDRFFHTLRGKHAAVVVLQNGLRMRAEIGHYDHREDADNRQRDGDRRLGQQ